MIHDELDKLERLAKAATPGPWEFKEDNDETKDGSYLEFYTAGPARIDIYRFDPQGETLGKADAEYIAALSPDVALSLISEMRALRAENEKLSSIRPDFSNYSLEEFESLRAQLAEAREVLWEHEEYSAEIRAYLEKCPK